MPHNMYIGWLGPLILIIVIFSGLGLLVYVEHLEEENESKKKSSRSYKKQK